MNGTLCFLFGHKPAEKTSVTSFTDFRDGHTYATDNRWSECRRCGRRLTAGEIKVRPERAEARLELAEGEAMESPETELRLALAVIEEMAEERHLLHGKCGDRFWGCSRPCCKKASEFLRGLRRPFCKARAAGTAGGNDPQDCDWPWCGCDPLADQVLAAIQEQGLEVVKAARLKLAEGGGA